VNSSLENAFVSSSNCFISFSVAEEVGIFKISSGKFGRISSNT
jgi:hypothetical protein